MIQVQLMTINSSQLVINWQNNKNSTMIKNHSFSSLDTKSHFQHPNLKSREIYIFLFLQLQFKERRITIHKESSSFICQHFQLTKRNSQPHMYAIRREHICLLLLTQTKMGQELAFLKED